MSDTPIHIPPFPPLQWDGYFWTGEIKLSSWAGFRGRRAGRRSILSAPPADGTVQVNVITEDNREDLLPLAEQVAAFRYLLDNEQAVTTAILEALFEAYPEAKEGYMDAYEGDDDVDELPDLSSPGELRQVVGLSAVHVLPVVRDGLAYVGFELRCAWDEEHGAGVMTHRGRVVKVGPAADSFLERIAERDAATELPDSDEEE